MKKLLAALMSVGVLSMLIVACDSSGSEDPEYFVSCKVNGTSYEFTKGFSKSTSGTVLTGDANGYKQNTSYLFIWGATDAVDLSTLGEEDRIPYDHVSIILKSFTGVGTYSDPNDVTIVIGDTEYDFDTGETDGFEVRITRFDEVGGILEGTFSGEVLGYVGESEDGTEAAVTDGAFKVVRIPDDSSM